MTHYPIFSIPTTPLAKLFDSRISLLFSIRGRVSQFLALCVFCLLSPALYLRICPTFFSDGVSDSRTCAPQITISLFTHFAPGVFLPPASLCSPPLFRPPLPLPLPLWRLAAFSRVFLVPHSPFLWLSTPHALYSFLRTFLTLGYSRLPSSKIPPDPWTFYHRDRFQ